MYTIQRKYQIVEEGIQEGYKEKHFSSQARTSFQEDQARRTQVNTNLPITNPAPPIKPSFPYLVIAPSAGPGKVPFHEHGWYGVLPNPSAPLFRSSNRSVPSRRGTTGSKGTGADCSNSAGKRLKPRRDGGTQWEGDGARRRRLTEGCEFESPKGAGGGVVATYFRLVGRSGVWVRAAAIAAGVV